MATKPPMKRTPKNKKTTATTAPKATKPKETKTLRKLPWEEEGVSELVPKPFNIRTNQVQIAKLKFVVDNTPGYKSVHAFCLDAVLKAMDKRLKKLLGSTET